MPKRWRNAADGWMSSCLMWNAWRCRAMPKARGARAMSAAPKDCLVIEDSVAGVAAARAAGMIVFGFVGASHFSPFDEGADLTTAGAELLFDDMAQLPDLVATQVARAAVARAD